MNKINLSKLELQIFTEQNALDYCQINSINLYDITELYLRDNELTDISGIKLFKNLKVLYLYKNYLTDISALKNLNNLEFLSLHNNKIKDISVLKDLKNLEGLYLGNNKFTDISVIKYLNKLRYLDVNKLRLESNQIQYIKSLKDLKILYCIEGFKDMSVLNQLNKNIKIIK